MLPRTRWWALLLTLELYLCGCHSSSEKPTVAAPERVTIAVTSYPLLVMAETMAGSVADVELVITGDSTSPDWKPTSDAVQTMQKATRILISGGDYEPWLQRVTLPRSRLIDTAEGYYEQFVRIPDAVIHQHGPDGGHSHPGVVWATWLDPRLAMSQLERTRDVLLELLPESEGTIRSQADSLMNEIRQLDIRLDELALASAEANTVVLGDAPVYQYLTRRLNWRLDYVHLPKHGPLSDDDHLALQQAIRTHQPSAVFVRSTLAAELEGLQSDTEIPFVIIDLCEVVDDRQLLMQRLSGNLDAVGQMLANSKASGRMQSPGDQRGQMVE